MGKQSAETHKFHREKVPGDGTCLFWSFRLVIEPRLIEIFGQVPFTHDLNEAINEGLRVQVANYIRYHPEMHNAVLNSETDYADVEEYCSAIEQGKLWGGQPELKALSDLYNIKICVIDPTKITKDNSLLPSYYGEDNALASECVYIYYNGNNHFEPLYLVNMENPDEKEIIFDPNDQTVNDLLKKFIREELKFDGDVQLGVEISLGKEILHPENDFNETERNSRVILLNTPLKRKERILDDIPMSFNNDKQIPISIPEGYYKSNKRIKIAEDAVDSTLTSDKINLEIIAMENLTQADGVRDDSRMHDSEMNQEPTAALPMVLNDEHQEEQVEDEEEPANNLADDEVNDDDVASTTNPLF